MSPVTHDQMYVPKLNSVSQVNKLVIQPEQTGSTHMQKTEKHYLKPYAGINTLVVKNIHLYFSRYYGSWLQQPPTILVQRQTVTHVLI